MPGDGSVDTRAHRKLPGTAIAHAQHAHLCISSIAGTMPRFSVPFFRLCIEMQRPLAPIDVVRDSPIVAHYPLYLPAAFEGLFPCHGLALGNDVLQLVEHPLTVLVSCVLHNFNAPKHTPHANADETC